MEKGYTVEKNAQILISLMKKHGVRKVVASPGATNVCFVASIQARSVFLKCIHPLMSGQQHILPVDWLKKVVRLLL